MTPHPLTAELAQALRAAAGEPIPVVDPSDQHVYMLVDQEIHQRAMKASRYQESVEKIRAGVVSMEAGQGITIEESQRRTELALRNLAEQ